MAQAGRCFNYFKCDGWLATTRVHPEAALDEQLKKNVYDRTAEAASAMPDAEQMSLLTNVAALVDPTPATNAAGALLSIAQGNWLGAGASAASAAAGAIGAGSASANPAAIAAQAPKVTQAIEAAYQRSDALVKAPEAQLQAAGLTLDQVAAARKTALASVQQAMLDSRMKTPNCVECQKLVGPKGERRTLQMPANGTNGTWAGGAQPPDGNGTFVFNTPAQLPNNAGTAASVDFKKGAAAFEPYLEGQKCELWHVTGNAQTDARELKRMMSEADPNWKAPNPLRFVLHHFEDGTVGYVPRSVHDKAAGGAAHTGGNSMINNELF